MKVKAALQVSNLADASDPLIAAMWDYDLSLEVIRLLISGVVIRVGAVYLLCERIVTTLYVDPDGLPHGLYCFSIEDEGVSLTEAVAAIATAYKVSNFEVFREVARQPRSNFGR